MDRNKKILGALLILLAVTLGYQLMNPYEQKRVARLTYTGKPGGVKGKKVSKRPATKQASTDLDVMLDLFVSPPPHSGKVLKNVFSRKKAFETMEPEEVIEPESLKPPPAPPPKEDPIQEVNRELSRFRVFGVFQGEEGTAVFLERDREILVVREGDRIDGKYLIQAITEESINLRAEHIKEAVHIDLGEF